MRQMMQILPSNGYFASRDNAQIAPVSMQWNIVSRRADRCRCGSILEPPDTRTLMRVEFCR